MSAFIVSHDHIDALLTFAMQRRGCYGPASYYVADTGARVDFSTFNATEIGRILLTENERSVYCRYPDTGPGNAPGSVGEDAATYDFRPFPIVALSPVAVLKACDCFDYQACENDDYSQTLAHTIIDAIRERAINSLPGYDDAPGWEFSRAKAMAATR